MCQFSWMQCSWPILYTVVSSEVYSFVNNNNGHQDEIFHAVAKQQNPYFSKKSATSGQRGYSLLWTRQTKEFFKDNYGSIESL